MFGGIFRGWDSACTDDIMIYQSIYRTPEGFSDLCMCSDGEYLTRLQFEDSRNVEMLCQPCAEKILPIFEETNKWLDCYFRGEIPDFTPKYRIEELTPFRKEVLDILNTIPYGQTLTYGDIARKIAENRGMKRMSAQAVGGAVGWNPICIIIPCHRVIGSGGKLTGYGGGMNNKVALLKLEGIEMVNDYEEEES